MSRIVYLKDGRKCKWVGETDKGYIVNPYQVYIDYAGNDPANESEFEMASDQLIVVDKVYAAPPIDVIDADCKLLLEKMESVGVEVIRLQKEFDRAKFELQQIAKQKTDLSRYIINREELKTAKRLVAWPKDKIVPRIMGGIKGQKFTVAYTIDQWGHSEERCWMYEACTEQKYSENSYSSYSEYYDHRHGILCDPTDDEILAITHKRQAETGRFSANVISNTPDIWLTPENIERKRGYAEADRKIALKNAEQAVKDAQERLKRLKGIRYDHDCEECVFLGQVDQYDVYFCPNEPTILSRWGNEGPEYNSGLTSEQPAIVQGRKWAVERGLIKVDFV